MTQFTHALQAWPDSPTQYYSCAGDVSGLPDSIYPRVRGVSGLRRQVSPGVPLVFGGDGYDSQSVAAPEACFGRIVPPCTPSFRAAIRSEANPAGSRRTSVSNSTHGVRALGWFPIARYAVSVTARGHPQGFSRPFLTPLRPIRVCLTLSGTFFLRKAPPAEIEFTGSPRIDDRSRVRPVMPPPRGFRRRPRCRRGGADGLASSAGGLLPRRRPRPLPIPCRSHAMFSSTQFPVDPLSLRRFRCRCVSARHGNPPQADATCALHGLREVPPWRVAAGHLVTWGERPPRPGRSVHHVEHCTPSLRLFGITIVTASHHHNPDGIPTCRRVSPARSRASAPPSAVPNPYSSMYVLEGIGTGAPAFRGAPPAPHASTSPIVSPAWMWEYSPRGRVT